MGEDVYTKLREFLDKLPAGYPATDTGVEIKILKKLFTPEEAISMVAKENMDAPPMYFNATINKIRDERGISA